MFRQNSVGGKFVKRLHMKTLITIICGLVCLSLIRLIKKRFFCVSGIFIIAWSICLSLSTLGLFEMDTPSWTVVILAGASMVVFAIAGILEYPILKMNHLVVRKEKKIRGGSCSSLLYTLHILAYIFALPFLAKAINTMITEGLYFVRENAFTSSSFATTAELMIFQIFIQPLFQVMLLFTVLDVRNKKKCGLSIFITIANLITYTLLFAGRYILFQALIYIIFIMYDSVFVKNIHTFIKQHKKVVVTSLLLIVTLLVVSSARSNSSVIRSAYVYFCGSFTYLSKLIESNTGTDLYLFGTAQWGFIYNFIYLAIALLFGIEYAGSNHIITQLTQYSIRIGDNIRYNSLGTMLHDFIADYGVCGSIFGVVIFALICNYIERIRFRRADYFTLGLYYYTLFVVVNSVLGYSFRAPAALTVIILLYVFGNNIIAERNML